MQTKITIFSVFFAITFKDDFPLAIIFVNQLFNFSDWLRLFVTKKRVGSNPTFYCVDKNNHSYENIPSRKSPTQ